MAVAQFNSKENKGNILKLPVLTNPVKAKQSRLHQLKLKLEQKWKAEYHWWIKKGSTINKSKNTQTRDTEWFKVIFRSNSKPLKVIKYSEGEKNALVLKALMYCSERIWFENFKSVYKGLIISAFLQSQGVTCNTKFKRCYPSLCVVS